VRWAKTILALMVVASAAAGQEPAGKQSAKPNPNDLCSVEGVVVKATTGEGLKKIQVNLLSLQGEHQTFSSITDSNGRFAFIGLEPGKYSLGVGGNGFPQQGFVHKRGRAGGDILTLAPGSHDTNLVLRLTPPGVITGTVHDEDGDPVIAGQVQALRIVHGGRGHPIYSGGGFAQTNDLGQYRLYGLEAGQYLIVANQRPAGGIAPGQDVYLPTFYPSTSDISQAAPVHVSPGDEVSGIDVDLDSVPSVVIRGRIATEIPVKTLRGLYVSLMPRDSARTAYAGSNYGAAVQDDTGNFELRGVTPGSYVLFANLNDGGHFYAGRALLEVGNTNLEGVTVTVGSGVSLRGRVRLSPGAELDLSRLVVSLQGTADYMGGAGAEVKADGTFILENISDSTYRVRVNGFPEEFYPQSIRYGGVDVLGTGLTVSHDDPVSDLDIVLSKDGGRLDGVVVSGQHPAGGAFVVLVPDPPNRNRDDLYDSKTADPLGRFSLLGLPPGEFKIFAWEQRDDVSFTDPDFLKDYEDRGMRVHIEDKKQQSVQLQVISVVEQ
jgi:hypothetical protein